MIDIRQIKNGYWWDAQGKFDSLIKGEEFLKELTMQITDKCNLQCPKCNKTNFTFQDLPTEGALRIINEACDLGLRHIHFTGGEPTLHQDFIDIVKLCTSKNLRIDMSSNGTFSKDYALALDTAGMDSLNFSWDFLDKRPNCASFIDNPWKIKWFINHMVMPSNYLELPDFLKEIVNNPEYKNIIDIQLMPPRGTADKFSADQVDQFNDSIASKCFEIAKNRFPMIEAKIFEILSKDENGDAPSGIYHIPLNFPCHRSRVELRVGTKGFSTCTYLYRDGKIFCDLNHSVKEAWGICKDQCSFNIPPVPHMCNFSCSPEVVNFNYFVEMEIRRDRKMDF